MKKYPTTILLVAGILGVLLAVVLLAYHLHQGTKEKVLSQFSEHQLLIARQTAIQIESYFHARSWDVRYLSSLPSLQQRDVRAMRTDIQANFKRLNVVHVKGIYVLDARGKVVYSTGGDAIGSNTARSDIYAWARKPANKGMVRLAIEKPDRHGTPATGEGVKPHSPRLSLVTPLYQESVAGGSPGPGGKFAGILLLTVDFKKMLVERTLLFAPTKESHALWIWVMDEDGTLLLQSEHPSMMMRNIRGKNGECNRCHGSFDYAEKILTARQGTVEYEVIGYPKKIAAFAPMAFENTSWIVVVNTPFEEVTGFIRGSFRDTLGLIGVVMVAIGLAFFSMYRSYRREVHIQEEKKHFKEMQSLTDELRDTRDYLENLLDYANAPVIVWDPELRITRFNRAFERLTGRSAGEVLGKPLDILFPPDRREEAMGHIRRTLTGERWETVEIPILRADGTVRTVEWNSATLYAADGTTVIATIAQGQDITERKRAERDIRLRNRELSVLHVIGRAVARSLNLQEILDSALETTLAALRIEGGGFYLLEPDGETMTLYVHRGFSDEFIENVRKIRLGEGVSGRAAAGKKPVVFDVADYPTEGLAPHIVREGLRTIASTPLISSGTVVGALNLGMRRPRAFSPEEVQTLASIGLQLGQAVRNAQLYESIQQEVAERKAAEKELRETRDYLESLLEYANAPVIVWDPESRITRFNQAFERLAGYAAGEVIGRELRMLFPEESREESLSRIRRTLDGEYWESVEIPILRKDGEVRMALWNSANIHTEDGATVIATIAQGQDITERKRAEEASIRLAMAVSQSAEAIVVTDAEGTIQYVNPAFEHITGYVREEAVGRTPRILKSGKQDEKFYREMWSALEKGEVWRGYLTNKRKDGSLYEESAVISPVRDASGRVINYVAVKRDMTDERELERRLRTVQRMEAVGTMAGGIAHDFNNALTGVLGYGEMLRMRLANDPKSLADLDEISRAAERAATLTRQLLTFARRQVIEPVNLDLRDVVKDLGNFITKVVGATIEIKTFLAADTPTVRADRGQIEQVVVNLCLNARDAMPQGGQLLVETGLVDLEEEYLRDHPYMKEGRYVFLMVSDTGTGMDEATRERVFEPFFTTKSPDKGTGLGLSVVYGIVKQHNGFIHVYSEPGKGSTFKIYFPAVEASPDVRGPVKTEPVRGGRETILLAEDEESIRELAGRVLRDLGYKVLTARNGEEAVDLFRKHGGEISLAVLDVVMPRMGGKEAFEAMRREAPGLKAIFMSGYSANAIHETFVLRPDTPFLGKPFIPLALARKVREVLDTPG